MEKSLKPSFLISGVIFAALLFLLTNPLKAIITFQLPIICTFVGPDKSADNIVLSDWLVMGPSNLKVGDTISVSFKLKNAGQSDLKLGSKGVFVAARNPDNSDVSFGFTRTNTTFKIGETITVSASTTLDKAGTWKIWPSYHLTFVGAPERFGPNEWHVCTLKIAPSVQDSDNDGVPDQEDNCPKNYNPQQEDVDGDGIGDVCDSCDDRDSDGDKIKNCLDECPTQPETYNQYQDDDGCPDEAPAPKDTTPPTVTISYTPSTVNTASQVSFTALAQDESSVNKIVIYVNRIQVKECTPPSFAQGFWRCDYTGGPYPAGSLTYKAEAYDSEGNLGSSPESRIEVQTVTFETPPLEAHLPCNISGKLLDFKYLSKTVQVKFCEAESVGGGCMSTPPFTCFPPTVSCKEGGRTWYVDVNRIWAGEETYMNPGPLSYQTQVSCEGTYRIQPVFKAFGEECEWQGTWRPTKSNSVTLTGTSKDDYDFRFTPQNLTPPSIQITMTEPSSRRASFNGEGEFTLNVKAVDSVDGAKSAKVTGNYRVSYFQSNETGPFERRRADETISLSQECGIYYQGGSHIPHASCRFDIPYYEGGKSITFDLRVVACDTAGNKVETTYTHTFPDEVGDLTLLSVEPVQVIYGVPLVKNKNTAFRAKINSGFPYPVETYFRLTLPSDKWFLTSGTGRVLLGFPVGWTFPDLWGPIKIPANARNYEIMLPIIADWQKEISSSGADATKMLRGEEFGGIFGVDVRLMPVPKADIVNFSVEIDPNNEIRETAETGNRFDSPNYSVSKTRAWRFLIVPYEDERGCAPYRPIVETGVKRYLEYLLATYPIAENKIEYAFAATPYSHRCTHDPSLTCEYVRTMNRGANELRQWTARLAESEGYDFGIAVGCGGGGQANFGRMAVTVGDSGGEWILAHEFNHATVELSDVYSYRAGEWEVAYCEFGDHYENCPEEYRGKRACQVWCQENERSCDPARTYQGYTSCQLWHQFTGKPERDCPDYVRPMNNCQVACEFSLCPNERRWTTDDCTGNTREKTMCEYWCQDEGGQKSYVAPDGRNVLPASDGFWVNKWIPVSSQTSAYFMDSCIDRCHCVFPWMRKESLRYCVDNNQCGHRLPDGGIAWGDIGDAIDGRNLNKDGYLNILNNRRFKSDVDPEGLLVSGTINKNGTVNLDSFIYLPEAFLDIEPGTEGDYYFVFLDKDNNVLSKSGFDISFYQSDPNGGPTDEMGFVYRIEWREGVKRIELQDKSGKVLASRDVSENKPEVKVIYPNGGEVFTQGKIIKIKWQASDKDGDALTYSLSLSKDNGKTWLPVDIDIKNNEYEINSLRLRPGDYLVKVRATDGVNTGEDVSDGTFEIRLARKFPLAYLIGILVSVAIVLTFIIFRKKIFRKRK